ncbi:PASTA domain-containing protein [Nocardioides zeae]|uniref:non-specific serine/threonine protein kinase n=1 Tax=Nocardioides imazamoxiresistens TaxID=3231893 RepID=A0ABU3Q036_9ACTN|nr:PASTA domain-containing protein [Nocardioides zeae]MDT9594486.1 PASTA domain-containing protein [Nocardioides zeae]
MLPEERPPTSGAAGVGRDGALSGRLLDGRYRLGDEVARGGMATVHEAVDVRLDRVVAVKVMHPGLVDPITGDDSFADRFVREARAAARLSHPNVVAVHDQGSDGGLTYLVMELVRGTTLRDVVRRRSPMGPTQALALLEPVVAAVAAAHRAGIVHRDVKPENVLIADDGRIKVADFGLARAIDSDSHHSTTGGVLIGTVSYLAPELVVDGTADARADVYALGVVLFELLTGVKPHQGETPIQVAYKHVHSDVPPPSREVPGVPPYVDALVARATSRDRSQRPADAGVLLHHVRRVAHALREGVADDPDLTADLLPRPFEGGTEDTSPDAFDPAELDQLRGDGFADAELYPALAQASRPSPPEGEATTVLPVAPVGGAAVGATARDRPPRADGQDHDDAWAQDGEDDAYSAYDDDGHGTWTPSDGDEPDEDDEDDEDDDGRRRRGPLLLGLLVVVALLAAVLYGWDAWRTVPAPRLLDLTQAEATERAREAGFSVEVGAPAYSETVEAGRVVATDPEGGADAVRGGTITLTVSQGPEVYNVPALQGRSEDEARAAIEDTNLSWVDGEAEYSEEVPEGHVVSTDPAPGTTVRRDARVTVVLSLGRRPIPVTDWTGQDAGEAEAALSGGDPDVEGDELDVEVTEEFSDDVAEGDVISQSPSDGTLYLGDTVELVVSKGPELVTVPDGLVGDRVDEARAALEGLGLVVEEEGLLGADRRLGYVTAVDPGGGEQVRRGSTVTLTVL